ncbi:MAG: peptidase S41, partial [Muribaculaceae bacterium]|nr:peptidase S41 [Muribaculaceae bacterium]
MKKIFFILAIFCCVCVSALAQSMKMTSSQKLRYAEGIISNYYVDTVNSDKIVEEAIIAMLKTLDPHSTYSNAEETKEMTEPLKGNFSGIGITFNMQT